MVATLKDLAAGHLEDLEENLYQVRPIKVVEILLAKVGFVARLYSCKNHRLFRLLCLLYQLSESAI